MTSDCLSFASVEIDKNCSLTLSWWKSLCHVATQNLGGKNICWVAECFDFFCGKLCGFQNLEQLLKTNRFIGVMK